MTLTNSIVAGGDGANCALNDFTSGGYNLEDDSTCSPNGTTDITGQSPDLGGLSDNGGSSDTLLPNAGSPAIGAIPSASCTVTVDQREYNRHAGASGSCTIGAVEYGASSGGGSTVTPTTIYVNTATGSDSNDCLTPSAGAEPYNGPCQTIAHAVALLTNSDATYGTSPTETVDYTSVTTISVAAGTYDESPISIDLPDRTLTIEGPAYTAGGDPTAIVQPDETSDSLFVVGPDPDGTTVTLQNLWLKEASGASTFPALGGGVDNPNGSLTLETDVISGFTVSNSGGGIANAGNSRLTGRPSQGTRPGATAEASTTKARYGRHLGPLRQQLRQRRGRHREQRCAHRRRLHPGRQQRWGPRRRPRPGGRDLHDPVGRHHQRQLRRGDGGGIRRRRTGGHHGRDSRRDGIELARGQGQLHGRLRRRPGPRGSNGDGLRRDHRWF